MTTLADLPPSSLFVHYVVSEHQPISRRSLEKETRLPSATVDRALKHLREEGHINRTCVIGDARRSAYVVPERSEPASPSY